MSDRPITGFIGGFIGRLIDRIGRRALPGHGNACGHRVTAPGSEAQRPAQCPECGGSTMAAPDSRLR